MVEVIPIDCTHFNLLQGHHVNLRIAFRKAGKLSSDSQYPSLQFGLLIVIRQRGVDASCGHPAIHIQSDDVHVQPTFLPLIQSNRVRTGQLKSGQSCAMAHDCPTRLLCIADSA